MTLAAAYAAPHCTICQKKILCTHKLCKVVRSFIACIFRLVHACFGQSQKKMQPCFPQIARNLDNEQTNTCSSSNLARLENKRDDEDGANDGDSDDDDDDDDDDGGHLQNYLLLYQNDLLPSLEMEKTGFNQLIQRWSIKFDCWF